VLRSHAQQLEAELRASGLTQAARQELGDRQRQVCEAAGDAAEALQRFVMGCDALMRRARNGNQD
jgi:hypothetical protein